MTLWRIRNRIDLDGSGGLRASGRWHSRGRPIVYSAPNMGTALIETLVHAEIEAEALPVCFRYLEIEAPDSISVDTLDTSVLEDDWREHSELTRRIGDEWLRACRTSLLRVPSVIVPATWNMLFNPLHPQAVRAIIARVHEQPVDPGLLR